MFLKIKISYWRTFSVYFSKESLPLAYISSIGLRRRLRPPSLTNLDTWSYPKLMTAPLLIPAPETPLIQSLRLSPDDSARLTQACICWVTPRCAGRIEHAKLSRQAGPKSSVLWGDLIFGRRIFGKGQHNIFSTPGRWIGPRFFRVESPIVFGANPIFSYSLVDRIQAPHLTTTLAPVTPEIHATWCKWLAYKI